MGSLVCAVYKHARGQVNRYYQLGAPPPLLATSEQLSASLGHASLHRC